MRKFVSPGVYTIERDISIVEISKNRIRKIKIFKIFNI